MSNKEVSADEIFVALQNARPEPPKEVFHLTEEQQAAIESSVTQPVLVVAGAGSGKTELMAIRVLWLVANGVVKPHEVLGLTFTRKAASELSKRINNGLLDLAKTTLWPEDLDKQAFGLPEISTYNSYANNLFRDNAILLGYEPESQLLSEGSAYQLARSVVLKEAGEIGDEFDDADVSLNRAVDLTLDLAAELNDNLTDANAVRDRIEQLRQELNRITGGVPLGVTNEKAVRGAFTTAAVVELAERYREAKRVQGFVDYSDQVALAYRAVSAHREIIERERSKHRVVLLDEYQDTSYLQTELLRTLFQDHPVLAVGDPNQSIYGWRGASATNLNEYLETFSSKPAPVIELPLTTSWRNPRVVLAAANVIKSPLSTIAPYQQGRGLVATSVEDLRPRSDAAEGIIDVLWEEHMIDEAKGVAQWMKQRMLAQAMSQSGVESTSSDSETSPKPKKLPTGAVLIRKKRYMQLFVNELQDAGLDVEVIGLGGLLEMPEIVDLVSALKVVHSPNSGAALIRLLAGPRWRIAPKDIARLHRWSRSISKMSDKDLADAAEKSLGAEYDASLVDALDLLADEKKDSMYGMSQSSLARLVDAAKLFRGLRAQNGLPLVEFVKLVTRELNLDIELAANPRRVNPFANLNAFNNIVANYVGSSSGYLGHFLEWLDYVSANEKLESVNATVRPGTVQVLTVHSAKGLEWDYVAVPALTKGDFPNNPTSKKAWLSAGVLPYSLRGDSRSLPELELAHLTQTKQISGAIKLLREQMDIHYEREERRLAYVAFTRPKRELLLSGARWKAHSKDDSERFSDPSPYITELLAANLPGIRLLKSSPEGGLPEYESPTNPRPLSSSVDTWPSDPLGERHRIVVETAAGQVNANIVSTPDGTEEIQAGTIDDQTKALLSEVKLLLDEEMASERRVREVKLPVRIPASRFKDFVKDPEAMAQQYLRPLPTEPFKATMQGTLFHNWVEQRFGFVSDQDRIDAATFDELMEEIDVASEPLEVLKANFETSRWAGRKPIAVESEIQVTISQNTFICKLDAVFDAREDSQLDGFDVEIVDWKTGVAPKTDEEIAERALQLALYRMAYSRRTGVPEEKIAVCLYYVGENEEIRPKAVLSGDEIIKLWQDTLAKCLNPEQSVLD